MKKVELHIENKSFQDVSILRDVNLLVNAGETLAILGPSGAGKTTLLRIIAGLDQEYSGAVLIDGQAVSSPSGDVGMVFQDVRLFPWMIVERNIKFASQDTKVSPQRIESLLELVGLDKSVTHLYPRQLSGGMSKRVGLARALANEPSLLLLDESFSELDARSRYELYESLLIYKAQSNNSLTIVMVTHDIDEAAFLGDRIIVFSDGKPATILRELQVSLPHPRNRENPEYIDLCATLMLQMISNIDQEVKLRD